MNTLTKSIQEMNPDELIHLVRDGHPGPGRVAKELARRFSAWHMVCESRDAAEARIAELEDINAGLRKWQDVLRPSLEAIRLAAWDVVHTPTCGALDGRLVDDAEYRKLMEAFESEATS